MAGIRRRRPTRVVTIGELPKLSAPAPLTLSAVSTTDISVSWGAVSGVTSYQLQRSLSVLFTSPTTIYDGSDTSYYDTGLSAGTRYYYRVKAAAAGYIDSNYTTASKSTFINFDPEDIAGLTLEGWYRAEDVIQSGGVISQLTDLSSNLRHINATINGFPNVIISGGPDSRPYLVFETLKNAYVSGFSIASPLYIFMLIKPGTPTGSGNKMFLDLQGDRDTGLHQYDSGTTLGRINGLTSSNTNYRADKNTTKSYWQVVSAYINGLDSELTVNQYPNSYGYANNLPSTTATRFSLGTNGFGADFQFTEMLIFTGTMTQENSEYIRSYFMQNNLPDIDTIVFLGDSITAGTGATSKPTQSFVALTAEAKSAINACMGVPGSTVIENGTAIGVPGKNLIDVYEKAIAGDYAGQWFVFAYGTNDYTQVNSTWKQAYKDIVQEFINWGAPKEKIILTVPPAYSTRAAEMSAMRTYVSEIADELGVVKYDCFARFNANGGDANYDISDIVHPNTTGHSVWADGLIELINF